MIDLFNIVYYYRIIESSILKNSLFNYFFKKGREKHMNSINKSLDYVAVASLFESENLNVLVAYKGEKKLENFYILNEFSYKKDNLDKFKSLFDIFFSTDKPKEFVDFFVDNDKFYSVFTYFEAEDIKKKYNKNFNLYHFDERCKILESILIYIDKIYRFPRAVLGCLTEVQNIKVDDEKNVHFNYDLRNMDKYEDETDRSNLIFENISNIITTVLEAEAQAGFNKQLHIVIDKCKNGVYGSIPELVIELKKAEQISKTSSWGSYIKYQISLRKDKIAKLSKITTMAMIVLGLGYLVYSKLNEGQQVGSAPILVSIGGVNYTGDKEDESDKIVSSENIDNQTGDKDNTANIVLSEGLDMQYEDYIVQHGDTISSICMDYYKDSKYITAVASFNGLEVSEKLTAGTILKLPNRTAIALYASR